MTEHLQDLRWEVLDHSLPDWARKLLRPDATPYLLSETDYQMLDAFLPKTFRRIIEIPNDPRGPSIQQYNSDMQQLYVLRRFNREARERSTTPESLPTTVEEATSKGYVDASTILLFLYEVFTSAAALSKYLDERTEKIRQYKPSAKRRMVNAGDLLTTLRQEREAEEAIQAKIQNEPRPRSTVRKKVNRN